MLHTPSHRPAARLSQSLLVPLGLTMMLSAGILSAPTVAQADEPKPTEEWRVLLEKGEKMTKSPKPKVQLRGARLKARAFELEPNRVETAAGMCHAFFIRSFFEKNRRKAEKLARKAIRLARKMVKRWPDRAEGHYWVASSSGLLVRTIGVVDAVSQGLAKEIERSGLAALKRDPKLYDGAVPRMLGRYYQLVPWPLKDIDKSLKLLKDAHALDPKNVTGIRFLAEAHEAKGNLAKAKALYARCADAAGVDPEAGPFCTERLEALAD